MSTPTSPEPMDFDAAQIEASGLVETLNSMAQYDSVEFILALVAEVRRLRAALAAAGVDREDTEQPRGVKFHPDDDEEPLVFVDADEVGDTGQADEPQREACWSRGPRIGGDGVARCVLPRGHGARHRADASWGDVTWDDIAGQVVPQQPTCQETGEALTNGMRCEIGGFSAHTHFPSGDTTGEQQ